MIILFCLFIVIILIFVYIKRIHLHIDFQSFFRKSFEKNDDRFGLYVYNGVQGCGKTYSAVKFCNKMQKDNNYIIITNVKSYCNNVNILYMENILDIIKFVVENSVDNERSKYLIFFDEIFTVLMKQKVVNQDILAFLAQLRKRGIIFVSTAQNWSEIPISFRRFCRYQVNCNMFSVPFLRKQAFLLNTVCDGYNARWDSMQQDFIAPVLQTNFAKAERRIINMYDTFETIKTFNSKQ